VVNASNIEKDVEWIEQQASGGVAVEDRSASTALLAVQGPSSREVLAGLTEAPLGALSFMDFVPQTSLAGVGCTVARTGYTGELGYEVFCDATDVGCLWEALLDSVEARGGLPVGLGARDTLRLEARLLLYGNDIDEATTPIEAGLGWTVAWEKTDFVGAEVLRRQRREGVSRRLVGFRMDGRAIARSHYAVVAGDAVIGQVTSGAPSPTLGVNIGLAYVSSGYAKVGTGVEVEVRGRRHSARIVKTPFVVAD
jgi:aminomethyltransferase